MDYNNTINNASNMLSQSSKNSALSSNENNRATVIKPSDVGKLDKNAFLKIFIAQLSYQDPTSPMDNAEFVSQMAQFSTMEALTNLNETVEMIAQILIKNSTPEKPEIKPEEKPEEKPEPENKVQPQGYFKINHNFDYDADKAIYDSITNIKL